jgi:hypothetical protein
MEWNEKVTVRRQYSVSLENRVGALAELCAVIEAESINLLAICAIDTVEEAVLRLVAEKAPETKAALERLGFRVIETDVIVVELENRPGATGRVASLLSQNGINIDYLYASAHPRVAKAIAVFRLRQIDKALTLLQNYFREG